MSAPPPDDARKRTAAIIRARRRGIRSIWRSGAFCCVSCIRAVGMPHKRILNRRISRGKIICSEHRRLVSRVVRAKRARRVARSHGRSVIPQRAVFVRAGLRRSRRSIPSARGGILKPLVIHGPSPFRSARGYSLLLSIRKTAPRTTGCTERFNGQRDQKRSAALQNETTTGAEQQVVTTKHDCALLLLQTATCYQLPQGARCFARREAAARYHASAHSTQLMHIGP